MLDERNGIDGLFDVAIKGGKIAAVGKDLATDGRAGRGRQPAPSSRRG